MGKLSADAERRCENRRTPALSELARLAFRGCALMAGLCALPGHVFWPDDISLLDARTFGPNPHFGRQSGDGQLPSRPGGERATPNWRRFDRPFDNRCRYRRCPGPACDSISGAISPWTAGRTPPARTIKSALAFPPSASFFRPLSPKKRARRQCAGAVRNRTRGSNVSVGAPFHWAILRGSSKPFVEIDKGIPWPDALT